MIRGAGMRPSVRRTNSSSRATGTSAPSRNRGRPRSGLPNWARRWWASPTAACCGSSCWRRSRRHFRPTQPSPAARSQRLDDRPLKGRPELYISHIDSKYFADINEWLTDVVKQRYLDGKRGMSTTVGEVGPPPDGEQELADAGDGTTGRGGSGCQSRRSTQRSKKRWTSRE